MKGEELKTKIIILAVLGLLFANFYLWQFIFRIDNNLKVVFFDIGQGDSIFIETPQGYQVLIDGGPSGKKVLEKLSKYIPFWDRTLDLIILTHPDYDHLAGLVYVLDRYDVKNILWTGAKKDTQTFNRWEEKIEKEKARIVIAKAGQKIKAGMAELFILYPFQGLEQGFFEKGSNESSIILKLLFGKNYFLFTGDTIKRIEQQLLEKGIDVSSQVLKVAHHGSKTSSSREFLQNVSPEIAVISCSKTNPYGHPHESVLRNLQEFGINILRTDEKGDIKITSDGSNLNFNF